MPTVETTLEITRDSEKRYVTARVRVATERHGTRGEVTFLSASDDDTEESVELTREEQRRAEDRAWDNWCDEGDDDE